MRYGLRKFGKALGQADKLGAQYALILGDDEIASGQWTLKSLADGTQTKVEEAKLLDGDDQALVLFAEMLLHELRGFPVDEFALGSGGTAFGFGRFGGDFLELGVGIDDGFGFWRELWIGRRHFVGDPILTGGTVGGPGPARRLGPRAL